MSKVVNMQQWLAGRSIAKMLEVLEKSGQIQVAQRPTDSVVVRTSEVSNSFKVSNKYREVMERIRRELNGRLG